MGVPAVVGGMNDKSGHSLLSGPDGRKRRVCYFYDPEIGNYYYGQGHPMKPHRIRMADNLLAQYGIHEKLEVVRPDPAGDKELCNFHCEDYVAFLRTITPETQQEQLRQLKLFNVGEDCPVFDGLYSYCKSYAGGSIGGALRLNQGQCDIAINWAGGLHHAKQCEASGFCYVNDIVLAILELLKNHSRVLYIDIDVHHGDGVEEAFYTTDRVMTVSFHKFGNYFPGTGDIRDIGYGEGKYYSLNVPLQDGIDDDSYQSLFKPIITKVMEVYQPGAVVLQCGADSLSEDRIGCFNLSVKGHGECVRFLRSFNVPLLLLGGGGYTIRNVARCWCYETAIAVDVELDDRLPRNDYYEYFGPEFTLHVAPGNLENRNSKAYIARIREKVLENLGKLRHVPSVPFGERPPDTVLSEEEDEEMDDWRENESQEGFSSETDSDDNMPKPRSKKKESDVPMTRRPPPADAGRAAPNVGQVQNRAEVTFMVGEDVEIGIEVEILPIDKRCQQDCGVETPDVMMEERLDVNSSGSDESDSVMRSRGGEQGMATTVPGARSAAVVPDSSSSPPLKRRQVSQMMRSGGEEQVWSTRFVGNERGGGGSAGMVDLGVASSVPAAPVQRAIPLSTFASGPQQLYRVPLYRSRIPAGAMPGIGGLQGFQAGLLPRPTMAVPPHPTPGGSGPQPGLILQHPRFTVQVTNFTHSSYAVRSHEHEAGAGAGRGTAGQPPG